MKKVFSIVILSCLVLIFFGCGDVKVPQNSAFWIKDTDGDSGIEPNPEDVMWVSPDIWITHTDSSNNEVPGGLYYPGAENTVYVNVRRNPGESGPNSILKVFWAKATPSLGWNMFNGECYYNDVLLGGSIYSAAGEEASVAIPHDVVMQNNEKTYSFKWEVPNPANYFNIPGDNDQTHFCLLATISPYNWGPIAITNVLYTDVRNNRRIAQRNINIVEDIITGDERDPILIIGNPAETHNEMARFAFSSPREKDKPILINFGELMVTMPDELMKEWETSKDKKYEGLRVDGSKLIIFSPDAWISGFNLKPKKFYPMTINFKMTKAPDPKAFKDTTLTLDVMQKNLEKDEWKIRGGNQLLFRPKK